MQTENSRFLFDDYEEEKGAHLREIHSVSHEFCIAELHSVCKDLLYHLKLNAWLAEYTANQESMSLVCDLQALEDKLKERKGGEVISNKFLINMYMSVSTATWRLRQRGESYKLE